MQGVGHSHSHELSLLTGGITLSFSATQIDHRAQELAKSVGPAFTNWMDTGRNRTASAAALIQYLENHHPKLLEEFDPRNENSMLAGAVFLAAVQKLKERIGINFGSDTVKHEYNNFLYVLAAVGMEELGSHGVQVRDVDAP